MLVVQGCVEDVSVSTGVGVGVASGVLVVLRVSVDWAGSIETLVWDTEMSMEVDAMTSVVFGAGGCSGLAMLLKEGVSVGCGDGALDVSLGVAAVSSAGGWSSGGGGASPPSPSSSSRFASRCHLCAFPFLPLRLLAFTGAASFEDLDLFEEGS